MFISIYYNIGFALLTRGSLDSFHSLEMTGETARDVGGKGKLIEMMVLNVKCEKTNLIMIAHNSYLIYDS
jgi:hypothetical protein